MADTPAEDPWSINQQAGVVVPVDVFSSTIEEQRARFLRIFGGFDAARWKRPSRCGDWDAHTVFRHLTDAVEVHVSGFTGVRPAFAISMENFEPQSTPEEWLAASADETPAETLARYERASLEVNDLATAAFRAGEDRIAAGPYGPTHWSVVTMHVLWDAWVHERDIVLADGADTPVSAEVSGSLTEQRLVTMYGAMMTTVPGVKLGQPISGTISLTHGDAPPLHLELRGDPGAVAVTQLARLDEPDLTGDLLPYADALAGRAMPLAQALSGLPALIEAMSILALAI